MSFVADNVNGQATMANSKPVVVASDQTYIPVCLSDETYTKYGVPNIQGKPRVSSMPYLYDIAEGNVTNHKAWVKNGYNGSLSASEQDMWSVGGLWVGPTTAMGLEIVSSSTNDTALGSGARTVEIYYLDGSLVEKVEVLALNGTTPVPTVNTDIYRVNTFRVKTVGATGWNEGTIDIRNLSDTPIYSRIAIGLNRAFTCVYTVPAGKVLFVNNIFFSAASNVANRPVRFISKGTYDNVSNELISFFMPYSNTVVCDGSVDMPIEVPSKFPAGTDVRITAISPDGASTGSVVARGWIETV